MIAFKSKLFAFCFLISVIFCGSARAQTFIAPDAVKTTLIDAQELKALVKSPAKDGPILINLWATWCGPCRAEFPDLVKIDEDYRAKGLQFFLVSIDRATLAETLVSDFLKDYNARMPSYLLDIEPRRAVTRAVRQIAPRYTGGLPATFLFDRKSRLVYQKTGVVNAEILRKRIEKVLAN